jgi:hypothetical protein
LVSDDFLDPNPLLDDALIQRLIYDLAAQIHEPPTLAMRYGFPDVLAMRRYLSKHPQIVKAAQKAKALMESDENTESRVRLRAMHATEDLIPAAHGIALDPRIAPQQRIDAFKQLSRVSGLDSAAAKTAGAGGPAFTLNILFRKNPQEQLTLIPDEAMPAQITPGVTPVDDEWDEEI